MTFPRRNSSPGGRCAACGRRAPAAGCQVHGPPEKTQPDEAEARLDERAAALPAFPGYNVSKVVGSGGFGTVYEARAPNARRNVAIKHAHAEKPEAALRLAREAAILAAIGPPYVPALLGRGTLEDGSAFLVMELVRAPSLADVLLARGTLPADEASALAAAVLRPLAFAHARGWVHRDLKPENVLFDAQKRRAVLIDFGLARPLPGHAAAPSAAAAMADVTSASMLVGTPEYMAPEQHEGRLDVDARADVYAMGVLFFELLTGRPPFFGPAALVREAHRSQRPPRPSTLAPDVRGPLEEIVLRCLAKAPRDRFANAAALAAALEEARPMGRSSGSPEGASLGLPLPSSRRDPPPLTEPRLVSVLYFASPLDSIALRRFLEPKGAQLVHARDGRYIVAFGHEVDENPARRALDAARALLARGSAAQITLNLAKVGVRVGPGGARRIVAPRLARDARFPGPSDPPGIVLSDAARAVLEATDVPLDPRPEGRDLPTPMSRPTGGQTPPFRGRDALLDALVAAAARATTESAPTAAVIVAERGYGKSHLRRALALRLKEALPQADIVTIHAHEPVGGGASPTLRALLRSALDLPAAPPPMEGRALLLARLGPEHHAEAGAAVALALGWLLPDEAPHGEALTARPLASLQAAPGAIRALLTAAASEALRRRARACPLFVLLDDAHFADDATLVVLDQATRAEGGAPIFVCVFGRPEFVEDHPSFGARARRREVHPVGALDAASAAALCRDLLRPAEDVPDAAIERIVERTRAVPLLVVELVRGLRAAGVVRASPSGSGSFVATDEIDRVPDLPLVEWLVMRELDAMPSGIRAHAQLAAVLGVEVSKDELEGVLKRLDHAGLGAEFPLDARVGVEGLVALGLLSQAGRGAYRFRHALMRDAIARAVPEDLRSCVHRAAVEFWRCLASPTAERALAKVAHHASRAGDLALAEASFLLLARAAQSRHEYLDAERFYTCALDQSLDAGVASKERRRALRGRGLMRYRLGRYADAQHDLALAREASRAAGEDLEQAEILLDEATVFDWMADFGASRSCVDQAFSLISSMPAPAALEARLLLGRGRSLHRGSCEEEAQKELECALSVADGLGEEAYETRVIALLMSSFILQGLARLPEAARALDRVVSLCEEHGDVLHLASAINNRALLSACFGDKPRMVAEFERVLWLGRHLGQDTIRIAGHYNLGEYLYLWDDLAAAEPHAEQALLLEVRRTGDEPRAAIELLPARMALYRGDLPAARAIAARVRARRGNGLDVPAIDVLCTMVELACGEASGEAWDALEARSERFSIGQERIEVIEARARSALREGRRDEAVEVFSRALDVSQTIPNVMRARLKPWTASLASVECLNDSMK